MYRIRWTITQILTALRALPTLLLTYLLSPPTLKNQKALDEACRQNFGLGVEKTMVIRAETPREDLTSRSLHLGFETLDY